MLALPVSAAETVIAALGDSLTAGYGLSPGDGLVPQLEAYLKAQGAEVRLVNAGVSGDTTAGGLARLDWTLTAEVDGLIVELGANDMLRGIDPDVVRANLDAILANAGARGVPVLLIGFKAPGNWGPEYRAAFDAIYPSLADRHGALLMPSFFAPLLIDGSASSAMAFLQPDGLHPNREGVARLVTALSPHVLELIALTR